jgi:methylase of polypeptide subunit release factors
LEKNGVVYTRRWVVDLILDLCGYTSDKDLQSLHIVEPSSGDGAFLIAIVERLIDSCKRHNRDIRTCKESISGYDLDSSAVKRAQQSIINTLQSSNLASHEASELAQAWVKRSDFLLDVTTLRFADFVVGNPPYIRLEDISPARATAYRSNYKSMVGRADIYVAFYEAALRQLTPGGVCGFICADRWMLNQYGSELRRIVTSGYSVEQVIELHHAAPFESEVSAYPAITIIKRQPQGRAVVARAGANAEAVGQSHWIRIIEEAANAEGPISAKGVTASGVSKWFSGAEPWPCSNPERLSLLKYLEDNFYPLDSRGSGTRCGIGVASGADQVFLTKNQDLVEQDRLLPIAMAKDIRLGEVIWSGNYLVNPWSNGSLIELSKFPNVREYFESHEDLLRGRHVGKKNADTWFRTIDRVEPGLLQKQKLYIADIKEHLNPVLDHGETYPHHNLYFIQSVGWDMEVLGGLLLSDIAQFFIECYGVRMRGGYLRFQAQYLRRIRLPLPHDISENDASSLREAFRARDREQATSVALTVYKVDRIPASEYGK